MPLNIPLQESHRGYIAASAVALTQAGISVAEIDWLEDVWDDRDPIRVAHLRLARLATCGVYGVRDVRLMWSEESGWAMVVTEPTNGVDVLTHPLCDALLPAPAGLVTAVRAVLAEQPDGRSRPAYRSYKDYDVELENQLDAYQGTEAMTDGEPPAVPLPRLGWRTQSVLCVLLEDPSREVWPYWVDQRTKPRSDSAMILKRLAEAGWLTTRRETGKPNARVLYKLTTAGKTLAREAVRRPVKWPDNVAHHRPSAAP
ncbi:DUF6292 family protein [Streptomyces roseifaciens]